MNDLINGKDPLIEFLDKLYNISKKADEKFRKNREQNRRFYKGHQWVKKQSKKKSKSVTNFLSLIVRDSVAILTDNRPSISVIPVDFKADPNIAEILSKLLRHIQYNNNIDLINYLACKKTTIEGIAYYRPVWNSELADGKGDIEILVEGADSILRDPSGEDNYFCIEKDVTLADIYRLYPDKADKVKSEVTKDDKTTSMEKKEAGPVLGIATKDEGSETGTFISDYQIDISTQQEKVNLRTWWIKDSATEKAERKETNEKKEEISITEYKRKYPYGRYIIIANKEIKLDDKACLVKHFPIVPLILDPDPETDIHGISIIDYIKGSQIEYNEMSSLIKDWLAKQVYPHLTADNTSGIVPDKITGLPGEVIKYNTGGIVKWESPPPLNNDIFTYMNTKQKNIEEVSGLNDVSQGRRPVGITAGVAIEALQEAAKTLVRPMARFVDIAQKKLGQLLIDLVQSGYTTERVIRLLGQPNEETQKIIKQIDAQLMQMQQQLPQIQDEQQAQEINTKIQKLTAQKQKINEVTINQMEDIDKVINDVTVGEYDVMVEPDSTLPLSRIEQLGMLKGAAEMGFVDRQAFLPRTGLRDWKEIDERLDKKEEEKKQMDAQAMQAQQQQPQQEAQLAQMQAETQLQQSQIQLQMKQIDFEMKKLDLKIKEKEVINYGKKNASRI